MRMTEKVALLFNLFLLFAVDFLLAAEKNILVIPGTKQPPVIDGRISPGEWNRATAVTGFQHIFGWTTERQAVAYVTYDEKKIYFAFRSTFPPDSKLIRAARERDHKKLCADDTIEIFISPDYEKALDLDYHFLGNSLGVIQDFESRPAVGNSLLHWNGNWQYQCSSGPGWWEAEVAIDRSELKIEKDSQVFGINLCRDYARYVFTNWTPGGFRNYARGKFGGDVAAVRILSLGKILEADASIVLEVTGGNCDTIITVEMEVKNEANGQLLKKVKEDLIVKAGTLQKKIINVNWVDKAGTIEKRAPAPGDTGFNSWVSSNRKVVTLRVDDSSSKQTLIFQTMQVKEGVMDWIDKSKQRSFEVFVDAYPSYGIMKASVDTYDFKEKEKLARIAFYLQAKKSEEVAGCGLIDRFNLGYGETLIKHLPLNFSEYQAVFVALDREGKALSRETTDFEKKNFEWENTRLGVSDEVIEPFTPLKVKNKSVFCWGREYLFADTGWPAQIISRGKPLLSRPSALSGQAESGNLFFRPVGSLKIISATPGKVIFHAYSQGGDLRTRLVGEIEYDGMVKYHLVVSPDREITVKNLSLDIPLSNERAILYHACGESIRLTNKAGYIPDGQGVVWSSREIPNSVVLGTFIPYFWVGDYDRGFCWMADNDRGWVTDDSKQCVQFIRKGKELIVRINLFQVEKKISQPREIVFAVMAGPARPEPEGWRMDKKGGYAWYCGRARTFQGYGKPPDMEAYLKDVEYYKKERGYWGVNTSPNDLWGTTPENIYYEAEWSPGVPTEKRNDYQMYYLNKFMEAGYIDGLYSDDVYPVADRDLVTGRGYLREDGKVQAGYSMFALRDFYKRSAYLFRKHNCSRRMTVHMTDSMILPAYCFWDYKHDNEWRKSLPGGDQIDGWDLGEICARSMSRQYGMGASWHTPSGWDTDPETGGDDHSCLLLLHDILGRSENLANRTLPAKLLFGIGEKDVEFLGYWLLQPKNDPKKKDVKVSAWVRKSKGTALVVAGNLSSRDWSGKIQLPLKLMGLKGNLVACDGEENHPRIPMEKDRIFLQVPRHNYRLVLIGPPGSFPVDEPLPGSGLEKPVSLIPELCDSFHQDFLDPVWKLNTSPVAQATARIYRQRLMLRSCDYKFAVVERPFNQDNVTVQVRVETASLSHQNWNGLLLLWENGDFVFAGPVLREKKFLYAVSTDGKIKTQWGSPVSVKNPETMHQLNWVQIKLLPEKIVFSGSADGQHWSCDWEVSRAKQLKGAPVTLRLGKSPSGKDETPTPSPSIIYFDDLIVGKNA